MPEIKNVYEKYKSMGFEVISACIYYNGKYQKDEYQKIMAIHKRIGTGWPLLLIDGNEGGYGRKFMDHYALSGVPQLFMLDGNGKLVEYGEEAGLDPASVMHIRWHQDCK